MGFTHVLSVGEDRVEYALLGCIWSWASVLGDGCISRSLRGDMSIFLNPNLRSRQLRTCVVADSLWRAPSEPLLLLLLFYCLTWFLRQGLTV